MSLLSKCIGNWTLNEASGATREDSTAFDNDLVESGGRAVSNGAAVIDTGAVFVGIPGRSLEIATGGSPFAFGDDPFSIAMWVSFSDLSASQRLLCKFSAAHGSYQLVYDLSANCLRWTVYNASGFGGQTNADWSAPPSTGVNYLVLVDHDPVTDQISIRVNNGTPVSVSHAGGIYQEATVALCIGDSIFYNLPPVAVLDELSIFSDVLTTDEATALYNGGAGLAYPFNSGGNPWYAYAQQ